jgi:hypothetical protein
MVASIPPEDQRSRWRSEYETDILRRPPRRERMF